MNLFYNCYTLWCNDCSFLCPLQKQQWKFSHLTQPASGNSQWDVVLSSLGHQLGSNLAWYSGLHVHCNVSAISFVWQVSCKAVWGLPADPNLVNTAVNKICCAKKLGTNEETPNSKTVRPSLCVSLSEDPEEKNVEKSAFNHWLMSISIQWVLYFWFYS